MREKEKSSVPLYQPSITSNTNLCNALLELEAEGIFILPRDWKLETQYVWFKAWPSNHSSIPKLNVALKA